MNDEHTVIGALIPAREPAMDYRRYPEKHKTMAYCFFVSRCRAIRFALERGPFLAAFDAGIDEVCV